MIFFLLDEVQKKVQKRPKLSKQTWFHMQFGPQIPNLRSDLTSEAVVASESPFSFVVRTSDFFLEVLNLLRIEWNDFLRNETILP